MSGLRLEDVEADAIMVHVASRGCRSCSASFPPHVLGHLQRGHRVLSGQDASEVLRALIDCGSIDGVVERLKAVVWGGMNASPSE